MPPTRTPPPSSSPRPGPRLPVRRHPRPRRRTWPTSPAATGGSKTEPPDRRRHPRGRDPRRDRLRRPQRWRRRRQQPGCDQRHHRLTTQRHHRTPPARRRRAATAATPSSTSSTTAARTATTRPCDQLYLDSPSGSEYEAFGDSCGDRNEPSGLLRGPLRRGRRRDPRRRTAPTGPPAPTTSRRPCPRPTSRCSASTQEQAECLAGKIAEAIEDGTHRRGGGHDRGHGLPRPTATSTSRTSRPTSGPRPRSAGASR